MLFTFKSLFFFNISLSFFMNSFLLSTSFYFPIYGLFSIWAASKQFSQFSNLCFLFIPFAFLSSSCCYLNNYMFLLLIQQILSWFVHLIHLSLIQLLFHFSFRQWCLIQNLKCQIFIQHLLQCLCKYHLFLHKQWSCLYSYNKVLHFRHILVYINIPKIHTLQFYSDLNKPK